MAHRLFFLLKEAGDLDILGLTMDFAENKTLSINGFIGKLILMEMMLMFLLMMELQLQLFGVIQQQP